jgi:hypothetical protein
MAATAKKTPAALPVKRSAPTSAPRPKAPEAARRGEENDDAPATGAGGENLDKVRDILFGSQMRDQDRRFARLEERLAKDLSDVRDESRARLDSLEAYLKKELQTLVDRLKAESGQRADAVKGISQELKEAAKSISDQLKAADARMDEENRDIRSELLNQSKALRDEIQRAIQESAAATQRAAEELRGDKVDRAAIADLFTEMAVRLNSDGQPSRRK